MFFFDASQTATGHTLYASGLRSPPRPVPTMFRWQLRSRVLKKVVLFSTAYGANILVSFNL